MYTCHITLQKVAIKIIIIGYLDNQQTLSAFSPLKLCVSSMDDDTSNLTPRMR